MRPLTDAKRLSACLVALRALDRDVYIGPAELRRLLDSTARRINGLADVHVEQYAKHKSTKELNNART